MVLPPTLFPSGPASCCDVVYAGALGRAGGWVSIDWAEKGAAVHCFLFGRAQNCCGRTGGGMLECESHLHV